MIRWGLDHRETNMVRMTTAQFALFNGGKPATVKTRKSAVRQKRENLPENIVTKQIKDFLESRGWNVIRMNSGLFERRYGKQASQPAEGEHKPMIRIGKKGQADWLCYRRIGGIQFHLFHMEVKAPGKTPKPDQLEWIYRHRATGTPADWMDSFDIGKRPFIRWYREVYEPALPLTLAEKAKHKEDEDF